MTAPKKSTSARVHTAKAKEAASEAAEDVKEAAQEGVRAARSSIRGTFAAVRDNAEVQNLRRGTREFLRKAEDPALIVTTAINPPLGLGLTGVIKGSRLAVRGLRNEAAPRTEDTTSTEQ